jgi:hypothetical protein
MVPASGAQAASGAGLVYWESFSLLGSPSRWWPIFDEEIRRDSPGPTAVIFLANLLDYTIEESTGRIVGGSREIPVKFEESWTFVRPAGEASWQLTAIQQPE